MSDLVQETPVVNNGSVGARLRTFNADFAEPSMLRRFIRLQKKPKEIVYEFTQDPALLHQYYRLREEMFISVWGLERFSGKKDIFDDESQILVARRGLQCIAGGRLTVSTPMNNKILPMEGDDLILADILPDMDISESIYGEFSRLAILPEFRAGVVFPEIARRFIARAVSQGVEYAFNVAPVPLARSYRQVVQMFGLKWDVRSDIKIPQRPEYEGIRMVLSVMDLRKYMPTQKISVPAIDLKREALLVD